MKTLLSLGGSAQQVAALETARRLGCRTVLCDYLPDNPGRYAADVFYPVSTTDREAVLAVAKKEKADGVLAYASDPAAPTAAYVAGALGLPGNPPEAVEILCSKDRFRAFLAENGFCTPRARGFSSVSEAQKALAAGEFAFPVLAKPVDSSGSKGVGRIDDAAHAGAALADAMAHSRGGRIIVEEYVEKQGYQVAGDGLSVDGRLVFRCFGNDHFDSSGVNPFVPVSASFPSCFSEEIQNRVHAEIQRLLRLLGMKTTTYNFDIRVGQNGGIYLMEVAPRSGGNYIPQLIRCATGVDLVECAVRAAMGMLDEVPRQRPAQGFWAYYAVHSAQSGLLRRVEIDPTFEKKNLVEKHLVAAPGDAVRAFTGANTALGILLLRFDSKEEMLRRLDHPEEWLRVALNEA